MPGHQARHLFCQGQTSWCPLLEWVVLSFNETLLLVGFCLVHSIMKRKVAAIFGSQRSCKGYLRVTHPTELLGAITYRVILLLLR